MNLKLSLIVIKCHFFNPNLNLNLSANLNPNPNANPNSNQNLHSNLYLHPHLNRTSRNLGMQLTGNFILNILFIITYAKFEHANALPYYIELYFQQEV